MPQNEEPEDVASAVRACALSAAIATAAGPDRLRHLLARVELESAAAEDLCVALLYVTQQRGIDPWSVYVAMRWAIGAAMAEEQ